MKRFFSFMLFVLLLLLAVASLREWHNRQPDAFNLPSSIQDLFSSRESEHRRPEKYTLADGPRVDPKDVNVLAAMSRQRILLARAVIPSVVSIITSKTVQMPDYMNDPIFQFFHQGRMHRSPNGAVQHALGSGVIVTKEGHIVTNNHVIDQMDDIQVELSDGKRKKATLVGTDSDTDIAVLKIDADADVTPLPFGDSDKVEVGETVMAVGNPYGFEESVTQGIISAKGRPGSEMLSDLFQIDAAINPGNSGGPLINVEGELIGVNEAIYSQSGSWQGLGFAIPAATVRRTMDSILKNGRVISGYLGVLESPRANAAAQLGGSADEEGALVYDVVAGSPADKASIQPGDVIQKFNHRDVHDFQDLRRSVSQVDIDASVPIELMRGGKTMTVTARVGERPPPDAQVAQLLRKRQQPGPGASGGGPATPPATASSAEGSGLAAGVTVAELTPPTLRRLNLPRAQHGVLVTGIDENSPAAGVLQPGDVIEEINQESVTNLLDFSRLTRQAATDGPVVLSIVRDRARNLVVINPS